MRLNFIPLFLLYATALCYCGRLCVLPNALSLILASPAPPFLKDHQTETKKDTLFEISFLESVLNLALFTWSQQLPGAFLCTIMHLVWNFWGRNGVVAPLAMPSKPHGYWLSLAERLQRRDPVPRFNTFLHLSSGFCIFLYEIL